MCVRVFFTNSGEEIQHSPEVFIKKSIFKDLPLCDDGFKRVMIKRKNKCVLLGKIDYIFTSPIKSSLQTCLLTNYEKNIPIYVLSLLTKSDCFGKYINEITTDPDIYSFRNSIQLDFTTYFWEGNPYRDFGIWWKQEFSCIENIQNRVNALKRFLQNPQFSGKTISIYGHKNIIDKLFGIYIGHFATIFFIMEQSTTNLFNAQYFE